MINWTCDADTIKYVKICLIGALSTIRVCKRNVCYNAVYGYKITGSLGSVRVCAGL
jgi:hypothetical protein